MEFSFERVENILVSSFLLLLQYILHCSMERPNNKSLDQSKLKAFAEDKINMNENRNFFFQKAKNIVGKGENAGYQHFLLFPKCFQKISFTGLIKVGIVW